jgi:tetratricopeptide (TPR) repeat protein
MAAAVTVAALAACGAATWQRAGVFHDAVTLHEDTLRKNPDCWMALGNLGSIRAAGGDCAGAVRLLERATFLHPAATGQWYELGRARLACGDAGGAAAAFGEAVTREPGYTMAWRERARAWTLLGRYDLAAADMGMVVRLNPEYRDAWFFRSVCRFRAGDIPGARSDLDRYVGLGGRPDPRFLDELARAPGVGERPAGAPDPERR